MGAEPETSDRVAEDTLDTPSPVEGASTPEGSVLVVDDSPGMRETLVDLLQPYWAVRAAADAASALAMVAEDLPDLVLADLVLPGTDGIELLKALKADPVTADMAVVMLSGRGGPESVVAGLDAGADDFLVKPFTAPELLARVRTHMKVVKARAERRAEEAFKTELLDRIQIAQRSQAFLLSAAQVLARSTGYVETVENLAAVAVPTLGDICLIDVKETDGGLRRMAARHVDPERQSEVDLLGRLYPPDPGGNHPAVQVLASGTSMSSETMTDEYLRQTSRDEDHYQLIKGLGFTSFMTVPVTDRGEVLGAMTLVSAGSGRRFGSRDLSLAEDLAGQVAAVVAKARRYEQEHLAAHTLQSSLLPSELPPAAGLQVAVRYLPGTSGAEVGGDWYDLVAHPSGASILAVGDVAGHDIGAAATMGAVRAGLRALMRHGEDPAALLELLQFSWDDLGVERMATLVVVFMDGQTGEYTVASAGHPPPLIVPATGRPSFLDIEPTTPLGCPPPGGVETTRGRLDRGDLMLLYSDGLVESRDTDVGQGLVQLAALAEGAGTDPEVFCGRVLSRLQRTRTDDIALLAATRLR